MRLCQGMHSLPDLQGEHAGVLRSSCGSQVHLRHLVGGRARSYMGELPHERIFQVRTSFPGQVHRRPMKTPQQPATLDMEAGDLVAPKVIRGCLFSVVLANFLFHYPWVCMCRSTSLSAPAP